MKNSECFLNKIVLVGCGSVGLAFINTAINSKLAKNYVLIDINNDAKEGNALDFQDIIPIANKPMKSIKAGTYKDCKDADLVVIVAGRPQKPQETRLDLLIDNVKIIKSITLNVMAAGFKGKFLIASNPVDIMTYAVYKVSKLPHHKIIGSGTSLDSTRYVNEVAKSLNIENFEDITNAYVIGEHGDSSYPIFSETKYKNKKINFTDSQKKAISNNVKNRAKKIILRKKVTNFGIGYVLAEITKKIVTPDNNPLVCDCYFKDKENEYFIGWPCVLNKNGLGSPIKIKLNAEEKNKFEKSKKIILNGIKQIDHLLNN